MIIVTAVNNDQHKANDVIVSHASFEDVLAIYRIDARSVRINRDIEFAEIKREVRGPQGWETRTTTLHNPAFGKPEGAR